MCIVGGFLVSPFASLSDGTTLIVLANQTVSADPDSAFPNSNACSPNLSKSEGGGEKRKPWLRSS